MKLIIGTVLVALILYMVVIAVVTKIQLMKKAKADKFAAEILEAELKELARWGVSADQVYIIGGKMTMSIYAMITLANNPAYLEHLRAEALALHFPKDFFVEELLLRTEKAKARIQARINEMRVKGEEVEISDRLQDLGIK